MRARLLVALPPLLMIVLGTAQVAAAPRPGFGWPLPGTPTVERGFAPPATAYGPGHRGVDLSASLGQVVLAAGPGRVSYVGLLAGRGVVTVTHPGGLRTTYEPVIASVRVGEPVTHGTLLGRLSVGHASCRRVTCLHWGLLRGQVYLNPLSLLAGGPMRLLPLNGAGRPVSGPVRIRAALPPLAGAAPRSTEGSSRALGTRAATGAAAVAGGALLGWTALRRQDARGRSPRRVPRVPEPGGRGP
jgi:hypothetical protein